MIGPPQAVDTQLTSASLTFTTRSSNNLKDTAARVVEQFRNETGANEDIYNLNVVDNQVRDHVDDEPEGNRTEESDEDEEFEFAVVCRPPNSSADEIFFNGEILPRYPLFDRSLLQDFSQKSEAPAVRQPLRKLFNDDRESASCSSSEADDLDGVTPGTYCIWKPKVESPERCKKSNSTGNTSNRWKLRNLLHRSNSDTHMAAGKSASVITFNSLAKTKKKRTEKVKKVEKTAKVAGADDDEPVTDQTNSANKTEEIYTHSKSFDGIYYCYRFYTIYSSSV